MAEFCNQCLAKNIGTIDDYPNLPKDEVLKMLKSWKVKDGGICEGCGYKYLGIEHPLNYCEIKIDICPNKDSFDFPCLLQNGHDGDHKYFWTPKKKTI